MLNVDRFFVTALCDSAEVMGMTDERIFDPARPEIDEDEDRIPYIIVTYDGGSATGSNKDNVLAAMDAATVSILCVANSREELAALTDLVHDAVATAFDDGQFYDEHDDWDFYITDASESAGAVQFDPGTKPCCFQTLTYQCNTEKR